MKRLSCLFMMLLLFGCGRAAPIAPTPGPAAPGAPRPTAAALPPTFTPPATLVPPTAPPPRPTLTAVATVTAIDFEQTAVELRYTIPAIELDRRLQGNIGSQIIAVDETTGEARQFNNQAGILLELQQALPQLTLAPLPEGCETCVRLAYNLPLAGVSGEGWLQNPILLASVENFMSVRLGPHFPPETQLGLRRGVSPYAPAHTLALTADGRLWRWLATDTQLPEPVDAATAAPGLLPIMDALPLDELEAQYVVDCAGSAIETLLVDADSTPIRLVCPEFALPATLLPLYLALDDLLAPTIADVSVPRPPAALPLAALLDYRRADDVRLTLYQDGRVTAVTAGAVYTDALSAAQIISLITTLLDSGQLQPGLTSFQPDATRIVTTTMAVTPVASSHLLLRGPQNLYDGRWTGIPDLDDLNALLDSLLPAPTATPEETSQATPTP